MLFNKASRFKRGKKVDEQTEVISLPSLDAKSIVSLKRDSEISGRQGVVNVGGQSADPSFFNFNSIFDDEQIHKTSYALNVVLSPRSQTKFAEGRPVAKRISPDISIEDAANTDAGTIHDGKKLSAAQVIVIPSAPLQPSKRSTINFNRSKTRILRTSFPSSVQSVTSKSRVDETDLETKSILDTYLETLKGCHHSSASDNGTKRKPTLAAEPSKVADVEVSDPMTQVLVVSSVSWHNRNQLNSKTQSTASSDESGNQKAIHFSENEDEADSWIAPEHIKEDSVFVPESYPVFDGNDDDTSLLLRRHLDFYQCFESNADLIPKDIVPRVVGVSNELENCKKLSLQLSSEVVALTISQLEKILDHFVERSSIHWKMKETLRTLP